MVPVFPRSLIMYQSSHDRNITMFIRNIKDLNEQIFWELYKPECRIISHCSSNIYYITCSGSQDNISPATDYLTPILTKSLDLAAHQDCSCVPSSTQTITSLDQTTEIITSRVRLLALHILLYISPTDAILVKGIVSMYVHMKFLCAKIRASRIDKFLSVVRAPCISSCSCSRA